MYGSFHYIGYTILNTSSEYNIFLLITIEMWENINIDPALDLEPLPLRLQIFVHSFLLFLNMHKFFKEYQQSLRKSLSNDN